jgi:hypothetical protein
VTEFTTPPLNLSFFGIIQELERDPKCFGERIIFIHTGGIFGLFPKAREIQPLLSWLDDIFK